MNRADLESRLTRAFNGRASMIGEDTVTPLATATEMLNDAIGRPAPTLRKTRWFTPVIAAVAVLAVLTGTVLGIRSLAGGGAQPAIHLAPASVTPTPGVVPTSPANGCATPRGAALTVFNANGSQRWNISLPADDGESSPPITVGDSIVSGHAGSVSAVHIADGATVWNTALGKAIYNLWFVDGLVVVNVDQVSKDARLVGLDPQTGKVRWNYQVPGNGFVGDAALTGDGGVAFRTAYTGILTVIEATTGQVRWSRKVADGPNDGALPSAGSGLVLYVDHSKQVVALDSQTGTVRWQAPAGTTGQAVISADSAVVLPDVTSGLTISVTAHSLDTGAPLWRTDLSDISAAFPDPQGLLLIDYRTNTMTLVRAATGTRLWRTQLSKIVELNLAPVTVPSTGQITVAEANSIAFIDPNTGHLQQVSVPTSGATGLAAVNDRVYVTLGTKLAAMTSAGISWTVPLPHYAQTHPTTLTDGGVAVQSEDPLCGSAS